MKRLPVMAFLASTVLVPTAASAQHYETWDPEADPPAGQAEGSTSASLEEQRAAAPAPEPERSGRDVPPPADRPGEPGSVVAQAGVGGEIGYARAGVLELGGSAGFTASADYTSATLTPSIGWFLFDNVQLSALLGLTYIDAGEQDLTLFSMMVEPSYHLSFSDSTFGFFGLGAGGAHVRGAGFGFSAAPRVGASFLVGRSGLITPALSYLYMTHDTRTAPDGTLLAVSGALSFNVGYTVMW